MPHEPTTPRGRVHRPAAAAVLAFVAALALAAAVLAVLAGTAAADLSSQPSPATVAADMPAPFVSSGFRPAPRGQASDWMHIRQVVSWLRYRKPPRRVVYLLGGSATRESVTSEAGWSRELRRKTGRRVDAYVLSTSCQTFLEDAMIVRALPDGGGVVLISVGFSRLQMTHVSDSLPRRSIRRTPPGRWYQHHYDERGPRPLALKRRQVREWRADHLDTFMLKYEGRLQELTSLVDLCLRRGLTPVLLDMPLDGVAVRHDLDDVLATYREGCLALAEEKGIRYLSFGDAARLQASDYFDLFHLLPSGRIRWQNRLSRELVGKRIL